MTCAEFHELLPTLIDSGEVDQHPHLTECDNCRALVRDLRYIAEQAKLLLPMRDPGPQVWDNIERSLEKEGLVTARKSSGARSARK